MADYIIHNGELFHYGVPGMKWGRRKAPEVSSNQGRRSSTQNPDQAKAARKAKIKKAVKIGAVVAGSVVAIYGIKKLKEIADRRAYDRGMEYLNKMKREADLEVQRQWIESQAMREYMRRNGHMR